MIPLFGLLIIFLSVAFVYPCFGTDQQLNSIAVGIGILGTMAITATIIIRSIPNSTESTFTPETEAQIKKTLEMGEEIKEKIKSDA